ncbi:glycoside hydrolase family 16 protein [Halomicrobium salinisoli]|uniref:glycoside hydrolase family 16 protein n=1 Tax=Halomicrobium salinisoli TaxID=2878391 RepID=UPI001CF04964|nr:glycoside hydrolase family 16 protein [Halomicrobium salinisoli]
MDRRTLLRRVGALGAATTVGTGVASGQSDEASAPPAPDGATWELTWSDEFDGDSIDESTWTFETGPGCGENGELGTTCNWGNEEGQYYTDGDNAWIEDGALVIEAREEAAPNGVNEYTSARLKTQGKHEVRHGRIDVRATLPEGQGIWPAIWMLGGDIATRGWPNCGEIDIMEFLGHERDTVHGTVHGPEYSGADGISGSYALDSGTFSGEAHTFSIVWRPDRIRWFVDGTQYHEVTRATVEDAGDEWVFDHDFFLLLNVAVGGQWPGYPDETTEFPQQMRVEYVRHYEAVEGSGPPAIGDGPAPTDPDGDGLYEDLNGNGEADFEDVVTYFDNMDDPAVTDHVDYYDYNGNGEADFADLVDLFEQV